MKELLFIVCNLAVTVYLAVTAWEDYKTCEVTRWKHLIGLIPASILGVFNINQFDTMDFAIILAFLVIFLGAGFAGIYGMADGFVFAILTLFLGAVGGMEGVGIVIIIMIIAGFSFLLNHLVICMKKKKRLFQNVAAAFVPHILVGYVFVWVGLLMYVG